MKDKLKVIHQECGKVIYYCTDRKYNTHEIPKASDFFKKDGTQCETYEVKRCYECNTDVRLSLDDTKNKITAHSINEG